MMELTMSHLHARERLLTWLALMIVALLAWGYLIMHGLHAQVPMAGNMAGASDTSLNLLVTATLMWSVMMVAMLIRGIPPGEMRCGAAIDAARLARPRCNPSVGAARSGDRWADRARRRSAVL